jgi:hypothetical protein
VFRHRVVSGATAASALLCLLAAGAGFATPGENPNNVNHDVSPPLISLAPAATPDGKEKKEKEPKKGLPVPAPSAADPVVQSSPGTAAAPALGLGFEGIGQGFSGPAGAFTITGAPPDPNAAVGPRNIVEVVNTSFAVFDKTGTVLYGPAPTNTLWSGFGGGCQSNNDGDGTVAYDRLADRWIISQFSISSTPFLQCVAVSTSGDPLGSYARYSFQYANYPDYPKLGVWPDGYYTTFNMFNSGGTQFLGAEVCAYDRARMLLGQSATQQCFDVGSSHGSLLPSDLDGSRAPPVGAPNDVASFATNALELWAFHVDWATPANSTLSGPTVIPTAGFTPACNGGDACIPQPGTSQRLSSLADRLMYRFAYRNFGDHESLVVTHTVAAGSSVGVRWYELRDPNGTPFVYQQGTYAPDTGYRWMGSAAMDGSGDIALGYSVSSSSVSPSIRVTGRLAGDPLGIMTQGESSVVAGGGSQLAIDRWGDYTSMSVDPSDDCTFWYTDEYLASSGSFNWHTRIASFALPGCGGTGGGSDFSLAASPATLTVAQGSGGSSTISSAIVSGSAQTVALSASGQPAGTTVTFNPASVTAGASSTMSIAVGAAVAGGTYAITVTGTGASATRTTTVTLTVPPGQVVANGGFEAGSLTGWTASGVAPPAISATAHSGAYSARVGSPTPFAGNSTLTQTVVVPAGNPTLTFWYQPHCTDTIAYDQIQMQLRSTAGATLASVLNVCSNAGAWTQVTYNLAPYAGQTVILWFNVHDDGYPIDPTYALLDDVAFGSGPANDFSINASPATLSVVQGATGTSTISTTVTSGSAQTVSLSASGLPSGTSASFNPASVSAGASSTLTLTVGAATAPGGYTVTVTGTGPGATHATAIALTVTAPPSDFSIAASPTNLSVAGGGSGTATISTAVTSGSAQTVALTASGLPSGTTASFNPATVTAGGSSTLTLDVAATTAPGTYTVTVTGTGTSARHAATIGLTVTPAVTGVVNGGFETGDLSGWTTSGVLAPAPATTAHTGGYSVRIGSPTAFNGNSTLTQSVVVPAGTARLTFWYQPHCADRITFDQIQAQLRSSAGVTLATVLNVCSNTGAWTPASFEVSAYAGQTVVLWFNVHDDGYPSDPTYAYVDDVAVSSYTPVPNPVQNGGFETGDLSGWTTSGAYLPVVSTTAHTGGYSARIGSTAAVNGDSTLTQTVTIPAGATTLTFWYQPHCRDTIVYDQIQMQLRSTGGATVLDVLNVCANSATWKEVSFDVSSYAGQTLVFWFNDHDDGRAADPTYVLVDDVAVT